MGELTAEARLSAFPAKYILCGACATPLARRDRLPDKRHVPVFDHDWYDAGDHIARTGWDRKDRGMMPLRTATEVPRKFFGFDRVYLCRCGALNTLDASRLKVVDIPTR